MDFQSFFKEVLSINNLAEDFIDNKIKPEKYVFLFGAAIGGKCMYEYLNRKGVLIEAVIDNYKTGNIDADVPIISLDNVLKSYPRGECIIIITAPRAKESIKGQLLKHFGPDQIYIFDVMRYAAWPENEPEATREFIQQNQDEIIKSYGFLEDNLSKKTLINMLLGHVSGDPLWFSAVRAEHMYIPDDIIKFSDHEIIVDLGANDGDTLKTFLQACPNFDQIYCFEPDPDSLLALKKYAESYKNICIVEKGAWSSSGRLSFMANCGDSTSRVLFESQLEQSMAASIEVTSVDKEIYDKITFLKMDIEGSELMALKGAVRQIKENKPKLAVSIYHKNEDIIQIPQYLKTLVPEYKLYLRHHGLDDTDTVLYACV